MPLSLEEAKMGYELFLKVKIGFHKTIILLISWTAISILLTPILKLTEIFPSLKQTIFIVLGIIWFSVSGVIFYKMISMYKKSISCPRCNQPFNVGTFGNVPFTRKCQHCGLKMISKKPIEPSS